MIEQRAADRRNASARFRYPERRTGFDRRAPGGVLAWYRNRPHTIAAVLAGVVLLNLADYLLTVRALNRGATEANPIMAVLFDLSPTLAGVVKLALVLGVVAVIWRMRHFRRILGVSLVALAGFTLVLAYHLTLVAST
ncbi:MAG: hypothetical protein HKO63_07470 [Acidimicrobiia bacterium]|nr:hypothetical protein [Acidimicrobiia bacterium]NNL12991.1 hypothetical protein [Acidimicrobiia bacterium]NNL98028.1 hypothetical protein [Acidimicrobiia bacterium]